MTEYDYIIIGAGAAGLMLANALGKDAFFKEKSILLLDKDPKTTNDRTWCFWEKEEGDFEALIHQRWDHIYVADEAYEKQLAIAPYRYKMLRGIDFYNDYLKRIQHYTNVTFKQETVVSIKSKEQGVVVHTEGNAYQGKVGFSSLFTYDMATHQTKYPVLQQHFIGWFVKTKRPVFKPEQATFMDFSVAQKGNTRFMYVLPFSETEALVEYTLFSAQMLPEHAYEDAIKTYLKDRLHCDEYTITDKEKGSIPMTCYPFSEHSTASLMHIGTAGGWAKASTGYTFKNTAKQTKRLVTHLKSGRKLETFGKKTRFWYYDLLMLDVLHKHNYLGSAFFGTLFKKRTPQLIFKFLNEETSFLEEIRIMSAPPAKPFIKALFRRLF